jgi:hypothetical protein
MKKQCTHCKPTKHYDDFGYRQVKGRTYVQPWCRICRGARGKIKSSLKEVTKADRERLAAIFKSEYPLDQNKRSEKYMRDKLVKRYQRETVSA